MNRSLNKSLGCTVKAKDGAVGEVEQFYFDDLTWTIRYMAVQTTGTQQARTVLLSLTTLGKPDWKKRVLPVDLTIAQVLSSPNVETDKPVSRLHEVMLQEYYSWPTYWAGSFYIPSYGMLMPFPRDSEAAEQTPPPRVRKVDPHLRTEEEIKGCRIHATDGNMGHVEDFLVDESWAIRFLVVNTRNWLPGRTVLVSPQWIKTVNWTDKTVFVDLSREAVKNSPKFDPSKSVTRDHENRLFKHLRKPETNEWVIIKHHAPPGQDVYVAGTFNDWDPSAIRLNDNNAGTYSATVLLPPGRYEYKFIVNGEWCNGTAAGEQVPNAFGTTNNVLVVSRTTAHKGHLRAFSRPSFKEDRPRFTSPLGG